MNSGHYPNYVVAGDFNNDGWPDFAVLNSLDDYRASYGQTAGSIDIFLNNKNGAFSYKERGIVCVTAPCPQNYGAGTFPTFISTADLNGDGNLDLIALDRDNTNAYILLGKGDGIFNANPSSTYVGQSPNALVMVDINHDGILDLIVANGYYNINGGGTGSNNIAVLFGFGDGSFHLPVNYSAGQDPRSIASGDFNGDGNIDIAVANHDSSNISILFSNRNGTFKPAVNYPLSSAPIKVIAGFFHGNQYVDLAVLTEKEVSILLNNGHGTFQPEKLIDTGFNGSGFIDIVIADFDGDGNTDLAVAKRGFYGIFYDQGGVSILGGNGNGTFLTPVILQGVANPVSLWVADFDRDNLPDLLVAEEGYQVGDVKPTFVQGGLYVYFNNSPTLSDSCAAILNANTLSLQIPIAAYGPYNFSLDFDYVPGTWLWLLTNVQYSQIARQNCIYGYSTINVNNLGIHIPRLYYAGNIYYADFSWLSGTYWWELN
ncbi:MAG: VCBS repeat-containing protein [Deltaproteobacteria bacterium]|nr:VCBS repeat-containing protein [Deltaproteobacteria bacterium]